MVRQARREDLESAVEIYRAARQFMKENGNPTQWKDYFPPADLTEEDIENGLLYAVERNGKVCGVFVWYIDDDPCYKVIRDGEWHSDKPYCVIHRVAAGGGEHGVAREIFDFCATKANYLRIDTHHDNIPMQRAVTSYGFKRCGIIKIENGEDRIAFDCIIK